MQRRQRGGGRPAQKKKPLADSYMYFLKIKENVWEQSRCKQTHLNSRNRRSQYNPTKIFHEPICLLRNKVLSLDVNREDGVNIGARNLRERSKVLDARVADCDVESAEFADDGFEHGLDLFFF
jgi:hypothetical protein